MIDFEKVGFTYDGESFVLEDLNLTIEKGSFVCILGGNGSGKSTIAKHINGLLFPYEGRVNVLEHDTSLEANLYFIRSNAGMVFQNPDDQIVASIIENDVAFGPENLSVAANELQQRVINSLAEVGLRGFEKRETHALSGGQKQRVAIAGVLAMSPQILILDEASTMLDPRGRQELLRVCKDLNACGMTIIMITHFMEEAAIADRVVVLEEGRIALDGTPQEVLIQAEKLEQLNLQTPFACKLSQKLQQRGIPVSLHISNDKLKEELCQLLLSK